MKILLIEGGWSSERDISLAGAANIAKALQGKGHEVTRFDLRDRFSELCREAGRHDFAFINLHGSPGEDGIVQAMLERVGCPYQGSGPAASFLALNKAAAKQLFQLKNIPTPPWEYLPTMPPAGWRTTLAFPLFAKSNTGGSSLGLFKASNQRELDEALSEIFGAGDEAIIESELAGQDITCAVLGDMALPPVLILPQNAGYFDFESKYRQDGAEEICPAPIADDITAACQNLALACHRALGLCGLSRTDMILEPSGALAVLESNTLPGMTATSLAPREAKAVGMDFAELLEELIRLGLARFSGKACRV